VQQTQTNDTHILNGIGWLYMILDNLQGDQTYLLEALQPQDTDCDVTATAFVNDRRVTLILSSWTRDPDATNGIPVRVKIPRSILPFELSLRQAKAVSSTDAENVYSEIRHDLAAAGNLQPVFGAHPKALATVKDMAADYPAARVMIFRNLGRYQLMQQNSLRLKSVPEGKATLKTVLRVPQVELAATLKPDEVCVLVFDGQIMR